LSRKEKFERPAGVRFTNPEIGDLPRKAVQTPKGEFHLAKPGPLSFGGKIT
jgi:hypothetical protein